MAVSFMFMFNIALHHDGTCGMDDTRILDFDTRQGERSGAPLCRLVPVNVSEGNDFFICRV